MKGIAGNTSGRQGDRSNAKKKFYTPLSGDYAVDRGKSIPNCEVNVTVPCELPIVNPLPDTTCGKSTGLCLRRVAGKTLLVGFGSIANE